MNVTESSRDYSDYPDFNETENSVATTPPHLSYTSFSPATVVSLTIYALVFLLGVPGNLLVIWITGFEMKRTVNTVWFLHLSIADLLCCLSLPFLAMQVVLDHHWPLGVNACKLIPSLTLFNMYMSVLLLTAISADRCALVMKPVWCQNNRNACKATVMCISLWFLALLMTTPSFYFRNLYTPPLTHKKTCSMQYAKAGHHEATVEVLVTVYRFVLGFMAPFLVISVCYGLLLAKVKSSRFSQSNKTLKIVLAVIIGFFVCWFPYHVTGIILASQPHMSSLYTSTAEVDPVVVSLAYINSCINPIIYVLMGQDFKEKFKKNIKSILRNVLTEDASQSTNESKRTRSTLEDVHIDTNI
ncbi:C5a anaphylatoxin chemotactic receptor 1-like [Rhinatrema bivittatum]|uniref:C5a anaphylatoxin chemotactic receptor 1-like n=1 Tax=Rhinatrema bivittatum TaxID=194408 RepID=UPI00112CE3C0|nr:C5a anaphylatoxin chemotactic receptor 1-like [Rhinatrema bivittatum]